MRKQNPWNDAHVQLKRLWDERIAPTGMSQEEFGELYGIGTQGMVSQYLLGTRPLNYDAAAKFARGFRCTIEDICPEMAQTLAKDIFPVLRRSLRRRRAAVLILLIPAFFGGSPSEAATLHNYYSEYALDVFKALLRAFRNCCAAFAKYRLLTTHA